MFANLDPEPRVFGVSGRKKRDSPENTHQNATRRTLGKARKAGRGKELGLIYIYIYFEFSGVALNSKDAMGIGCCLSLGAKVVGQNIGRTF